MVETFIENKICTSLAIRYDFLKDFRKKMNKLRKQNYKINKNRLKNKPSDEKNNLFSTGFGICNVKTKEKKLYFKNILNGKVVKYLDKKTKDFFLNELSKKQEVTKYNGTTMVMSDDSWYKLNNDRTKEQVTNMLKTKMCNNIRYRNLIMENIAIFCDKKNEQIDKKEDWFKQEVNLPFIDFGSWINLIFSDMTKNLYDHYLELHDLIKDGCIKDFKVNEHLEYFGVEELDFDDVVMYCEEEDLILVNYNKSCVFFKFKKLELRVHLAQTPGMSDLYKKFLNSNFIKEGKMQVSDLVHIESEILKKNDSDPINYWAGIVANYLCIHVDRYKELLMNSNQYIYKNRNTGKLEMWNDFSGVHKTKFVKELWFSDSPVNIGVVNFEGMSIRNPERYPFSLIFLQNTGGMPFEKYAIRNKKDPLVFALLNLYVVLNDFGQPIRLFRNNDDVGYEFPKISVNKKNDKKDFLESDIEYDFKRHINTHAWFKYENVNRGKKSEYYNDFDLTDLDHKKKQRILVEKKRKFIELIDKMKTQKLNNRELRYLSLFFSYSNQGSYNCANIRIKSILTIINDNIKKYGEFLDVIKKRYGGNANIICSLFIFWTNVKITSTGNNILDDFSIFYVKDACWLQYTKKISEIVKTENLYDNKEIGLSDFKNLQYLDTFIGPMGKDGKNGLQSISQRVYIQHQKMILKNFGLESDLNNFELADKLVKIMSKHYWSKVIEESGNNFNGIVYMIKNRQDFTTDSGSGGIRSPLKDPKNLDKIKKYYSEYKPKAATKNSAFQSECDMWFERVIFDIPYTFCDMVLKRKENGKYRYIYSVTASHYLMNAMCSKHLEPYMNQIGIIQVLDESNVFTHNFDNFIGPEDCIDFSEFNDQHEESKLGLVWEGLRDAVITKGMYGELQREFIFLCNWMKLAVSKMLTRLDSDNSVMFEQKGRLASGQQLTTGNNNINFKFYEAMNIVNRSLIFEDVDSNLNKEIRSIFEKSVIEDNSYFMNELNKTECLGDDGRSQVGTIKECAIHNEVAILTGLMLKLNKCLVGVGVSEFLRKLQVKDYDGRFTITKGYANRSIASLVCGNPEGNEDKHYLSRITMFYEGITNIRIRSGVSNSLDQLFENAWSWISRLNQENKNINKTGLPTEILYIKKSRGGLGFIRTDGMTFKNKTKLIPAPRVGMKDNDLWKDIELNALEQKNQKDLESVLKYGKPNGKKILRRQKQSKMLFFQTNNLKEKLYDEEFIQNIYKYNKYLLNNIKGEYIKDYNAQEVENVKRNFNSLSKKIKPYFSVQGGLTKSTLTKIAEKIDGLKRNLELVDHDKPSGEICIQVYGERAYYYYMLEKEFSEHNILNEFIEPNIYNVILSHFIFICKNKLTIREVRLFMHYYLKFSTE